MTGNDRRPNQPVRLNAVLAALFKRLGWGRRLEEGRIWEVWEEAVGPEIARHARPRQVRDGRLVVEADQSSWMNELMLIRPRLIRQINERTSAGLVREIQIGLMRTEDGERGKSGE
jgi:predicted nucleic acid-binding Zn ribbon protein